LWYWRFFFLLSCNSKEEGWTWSIHGNSDEDDGGTYDISSFLDMKTWIIRFPGGGIKPAVLFSQNKPATSNQPAVLFSQNKPALAISHQPTEQAD
jgi:hypothetical protein